MEESSVSINLSVLFDYLIGPAGAVILSVVMLWWIAMGIQKVLTWLATRVEQWINKHFDQIDALVKESAQDRKLYKDSIIEILHQFDRLDNKLDKVLERVEESNVDKVG
jgi:3-methyladenine DNA glycosylase/8-oxoguanine DNA glycosylase